MLLCRKVYGYRRAFAGRAYKLEFRVVVFDRVLDYRQTESGAARLLRVALVDAVKTLEYPALMLGRNADAGVADRKQGAVRIGLAVTVTLPLSTLYLIALSHRLYTISYNSLRTPFITHTPPTSSSFIPRAEAVGSSDFTTSSQSSYRLRPRAAFPAPRRAETAG